MASPVKGVEELRDHILKAKEFLKDTEESIKKVTGRTVSDARHLAVAKGRVGADDGQRKILHSALKRTVDARVAVKRILSGNYEDTNSNNRFASLRNRLGPRQSLASEVEDVGKRSIASSVVYVTESKSRDDAIKELERTESTQLKERNRRMFGNLLGTLRNFDVMERVPVTEDALERRREVEKRIDDVVAEDKEAFRRERVDLFETRKRKANEIRQMERKIRLVELFNKWKTETCKLKMFVRTTGNRPIYYLPRVMTPEVQVKLDASIKMIDESIAARQSKLEDEIAMLMFPSKEHGQLRRRITANSRSASESNNDDDDEVSPKKGLLSAVVAMHACKDQSNNVKDELMDQELPELEDEEDQQPMLTAAGDERPQLSSSAERKASPDLDSVNVGDFTSTSTHAEPSSAYTTTNYLNGSDKSEFPLSTVDVGELSSAN